MHDTDLSEGLLDLRQLELRVMAQEMALIATQLRAQSHPATAQEQLAAEELERQLHHTRAHHASQWRHIANRQQQLERQQRRDDSSALAWVVGGVAVFSFVYLIGSMPR